MLPSMLNGQPRSNEELLRIVDTCIDAINALFQGAGEDTLHFEIDLLLREKMPQWMLYIKTLMLSEEHQAVKETDDRLRVLEELCRLSEVDKEIILFLKKVSSLDELKEVYQKIVFCIRRMELDMFDEECKDFLHFIEKWEISATCLIMGLEKGAIYDKIKAGNKLAHYLCISGYQEEAKRIIMWVEQKQIEGNVGEST